MAESKGNRVFLITTENKKTHVMNTETFLSESNALDEVSDILVDKTYKIHSVFECFIPTYLGLDNPTMYLMNVVIKNGDLAFESDAEDGG